MESEHLRRNPQGLQHKEAGLRAGHCVGGSKAQASTEAITYQLREDQYRSIELTELRRGCIDLITKGTAAGYTSITLDANGLPKIVYDEAEGSLLTNWRPPLANGSVAEFFRVCMDWANATYEFDDYFWAGSERWPELANVRASDSIFEKFLRAGSASVLAPVQPGYERSVILFLKTGLIWNGGYLPLFTSPDMLDVYAELGQQLDPPEQVGDSWKVPVPTSMVMLQEDDVLPVFPIEAPEPDADVVPEPVPDERVPF
jgi:hypothetical protein